MVNGMTRHIQNSTEVDGVARLLYKCHSGPSKPKSKAGLAVLRPQTKEELEKELKKVILNRFILIKIGFDFCKSGSPQENDKYLEGILSIFKS